MVKLKIKPWYLEEYPHLDKHQKIKDNHLTFMTQNLEDNMAKSKASFVINTFEISKV